MNIQSILRPTLLAGAACGALILGGCATTQPSDQDVDSTMLKTADNDNDGLPNVNDSCPNEKGLAEFYGCASEQLVEITPDRLIVHGDIYFETDSAELKGASDELLHSVAAVLNEHPEVEHVLIEGHTDATGTEPYNIELSRERAETVANFLENCGVDDDRLIARGAGEYEPEATNMTDDGRALNRRVEFLFVAPTESPENADS